MPGTNDYEQINKSITKQDLNYLLGLLFDGKQEEDSEQDRSKEDAKKPIDRSDTKTSKKAEDRPGGKPTDRSDAKTSKPTDRKAGSKRASIDKAKSKDSVEKVDSGGKDVKAQKSIDSLKLPGKPLGRISKMARSESSPRLNTKTNIKLVSAIKEKLRESTIKEASKYPPKRKASSRLRLLNRLRGQTADVPLEEMSTESVYFAQYLLNCVNNSVALRQSSPPFDCHPDLLKRYLAHAHQITNFHDTCELTPIVLKFIVLDANLTPAKGDRYDPYFKVFLPGKQNGKQAHKSRHFHNEPNPKWNESFQVPVTRSVS